MEIDSTIDFNKLEVYPRTVEHKPKDWGFLGQGISIDLQSHFVHERVHFDLF